MKKAKGNSDTPIKLTKEAIIDLQCQKIYSTQVLQKLFTLMHQCMGWGGAYCEGMSTGGSWINTEKNWHINALESKSILLSIMSIVKDYGIHVKVFSDSTTVIACINKLGTSHSELCHHITKQIGMGREKRHTYYSCPYTRS